MFFIIKYNFGEEKVYIVPTLTYNVEFIPSQQEGLQGLFQEDAEESEHQVALNIIGDTWFFC